MVQVHLEVVQLSLITEILMVLFKWGFGFAIWLLGFDHWVIFFHRPVRLICGAALVLISSVANHVKFNHEVSVGKILRLDEPLLEILAFKICILCELHPAWFLLTTGRLGVLVILITGHCLEQQGICVIGQLETLNLLDIWFFVWWDRGLIARGRLNMNVRVLFTWLNQNFRITTRPFANYLRLLLENAISNLTQVERLLYFCLCRLVLFSCRLGHLGKFSRLLLENFLPWVFLGIFGLKKLQTQAIWPSL